MATFNAPTFSLNAVKRWIDAHPTGLEGEKWIPKNISSTNARASKMRYIVTLARQAYSNANGQNAKNTVVRNFHTAYTTWHNEIHKAARKKMANLNKLRTLTRTGNKAGLNAFIAELNRKNKVNSAVMNAALKKFSNKYTKAPKNNAATKAKLANLMSRKENLESKRNALEHQINELIHQIRPLLRN